MKKLARFLAHEKQKIGWRFWLLWVAATNVGFWTGAGLEWLILGQITNIIAVPLGGIGQSFVLNRHLPTDWTWAAASAVGWWLGMASARWLLNSFFPNITFWPHAVVVAGIGGIFMGLTTLWVLRRAGLDARWWWILASAVAWAAQAPGMITGLFLSQMLRRSQPESK